MLLFNVESNRSSNIFVQHFRLPYLLLKPSVKYWLLILLQFNANLLYYEKESKSEHKRFIYWLNLFFIE